MRNSCAPGTQAVGKQVLYKAYAKKIDLKLHNCNPQTLYLTPHQTNKMDNSLIFTLSTRQWLRIVGKPNKNELKCTKINTQPMQPMFGIDLTPSGVHTYLGESFDYTTILKEDVAGKGVLANGIIVLIPTDLLLEEYN
jgi:hypothetical protein